MIADQGSPAPGPPLDPDAALDDALGAPSDDLWAEIRREADADVAHNVAKLKRGASAETICLSCGSQLLDHDHLEWCDRRVRPRPVDPELTALARRILRDAPPAKDDYERRLRREIERIAGIKPKPARLPPRHDDHERRARYIQAALEREAATTASAVEGDRNRVLSKSAWALARFACDGELSDGDVLDALVPAAVSTGLSLRETHACIRAALRRRCAA